MAHVKPAAEQPISVTMSSERTPCARSPAVPRFRPTTRWSCNLVVTWKRALISRFRGDSAHSVVQQPRRLWGRATGLRLPLDWVPEIALGLRCARRAFPSPKRRSGARP
jgi:hypothetical protein